VVIRTCLTQADSAEAPAPLDRKRLHGQREGEVALVRLPVDFPPRGRPRIPVV
jgi:hypothetical protein